MNNSVLVQPEAMITSAPAFATALPVEYRHFLRKLYAEARCVRLMKCSCVYTQLEHTVHRWVGLMNAVESIVLKRG